MVCVTAGKGWNWTSSGVNPPTGLIPVFTPSGNGSIVGLFQARQIITMVSLQPPPFFFPVY